jgi:hypothetical protein
MVVTSSSLDTHHRVAVASVTVVGNENKGKETKTCPYALARTHSTLLHSYSSHLSPRPNPLSLIVGMACWGFSCNMTGNNTLYTLTLSRVHLYVLPHSMHQTHQILYLILYALIQHSFRRMHLDVFHLHKIWRCGHL